MDKPVETPNVEDNDVITNTSYTKQRIKKSKVGSTSAGLEEVVNLLKSIQSNKKEKDDYQLFGEQIAIKLRNITSPKVKFDAQQIINKTLFEADNGMMINSYHSQLIIHQQTHANTYPPQNINYQSQHSSYLLPQTF